MGRKEMGARAAESVAHRRRGGLNGPVQSEGVGD